MAAKPKLSIQVIEPSMTDIFKRRVAPLGSSVHFRLLISASDENLDSYDRVSCNIQGIWAPRDAWDSQ